MKNSIGLNLIPSSKERENIRSFYINKYFNLFMNNYEWTNITNEQKWYIMKQFWAYGTIACFKVNFGKTDILQPSEMPICFCPYAPILYGVNDNPVRANLIQVRGAPFIPTDVQDVDKDIVIGYAQRNKKSVFSMVSFYIDKLTDIEMTIRTSLIAQKMPFLIKVSPENELRMKRLFENLVNDEIALYVGLDEENAIESLITGSNYVIDKLYDYKTAVENELKTFIGVDNIGSIEKKEHLQKDEANANNQEIQTSGDIFLDCFKEFCEKISKILFFPMSVYRKIQPMNCPNKDQEEQNDQEGGNENE